MAGSEAEAVSSTTAKQATSSRGDALALFTTVVWGGTLPAMKPIVHAVQPFVFGAARFWVIGIGLLAIAAMKGENLRLKWSDTPPLIGLGLLGFGILQTMNPLALRMTSASKAAVLMATVPAFGALYGLVRGERGAPRLWLGIGIAFVGVFLLINDSVTTLHLGGGSLVGDLMFLSMAAIFALYTTLSQKSLLRLGALKAGAYLTLFGAVFMLPPAIYGAIEGPVFPADKRLWINFAFVALLSGVVGFSTWYSAVSQLGITRALLYQYLVPVFAVFGAVLFLGESFSLVQAGGAVLVLLGLIVARSRRLTFRRRAITIPNPGRG